MDNKDALEAFGKCYNNNDFSSISKLLRDDIVYEAYDCLYKITTIENVIKILEGSIQRSTIAYIGYYFWKTNLVRHLSKCVLICDSETLKCIRIISIKIKKKKIVKITGFNPKDYEHTRGKKILG